MKLTPERRLQIPIAKWLNWALAKPQFWTYFPAGGGGFWRGTLLKRMGMKSGCHDLWFVRDGRLFTIELKADGGTLKPSQETMHPIMVAAGIPGSICTSQEEVEAQLLAWGFTILSEPPTKTALRQALRDPTPADFPPSDTIGRRKRLARPLDFR